MHDHRFKPDDRLAKTSETRRQISCLSASRFICAWHFTGTRTALIRKFTKIAEHNLPCDVVYISNKYYAVCGGIIEANDGRLDKFIGDGIMATFGATGYMKQKCLNAVEEASKILNSVADMNA